MAIISNQSAAAWKQAAMQRAEKLTDYWDVIKAWAGRSAEIVLTVCMFVSLVGMLPGVNYWPWVSNTVLAVQMIMLDFGGFALHTLAEHARDSGEEEAARKAESMANFLIGLVIATLAVITVGQLAALAGPFAGLVTAIVKYTEPVLILVRVVSSVKYIHTIHSLRGSTAALNPIQVASLEQRMQEQVAQIQTTSSQAITEMKFSISDQVAHEVAQISTALSGVVAHEVAQRTATIGEGVATQIAQLHYRLDDENAQRTLSGNQDTALLSEQVGQLVGLINDQAQVIQHLTNELAGVRREVRTTVTEIRSFTQETPALPAAAPTIVDASSEPGERVKAFLQQWSSPKKPTIQAIMDACQVAKKTASRYREDFYGVATSSQNEEDE